jgi:tetratricopeptide repeat protein 8
MDPLWLAMSKLRRNKLDDCIKICDEVLSQNPGDQAAWYVKCKAVIKQNYIDDIEMDEEGVAEMLMDENALASVPRPGTSLSTPQVSKGSSGSGSYDQGLRPVSQSGRPVTGFARPSSSRPMSGNMSVRDALQSSRRMGTASRPMTNLGREVRLGTASLSATGALVDVDKLNIKKYAARTGMGMVLVDYLLYVEHNVRKALELCAEATKEHDFKDWWWKAKLGKCYFKIGLFRDAEKQLRSSIKVQPVINTYLELCNVYIRLDLPNTALDILQEARFVLNVVFSYL